MFESRRSVTAERVAMRRAAHQVLDDCVRLRIPAGRLPPHQRARFDYLARRVALLGEPSRTFFDPPDLAASLREFGVTDVEDVDADALISRDLSSRGDGLIIEGIGRMAHLARARV